MTARPRSGRAAITEIRLLALGVALLAALGARTGAETDAAPPRTGKTLRASGGAAAPGTGEASAVGSEKCAECHPEIADFYRASRHQRPFFRGMPGMGCESCHGPGSKHAESADPGEIINREQLRKYVAHQTSDACLSCHRTNLRHIQGWFFSQHSRAEISCWDCHAEALHHLAKDGKPLPASALLPDSKERITNLFAANPNEYCYRCHERQRMEFALPFRHPLERGKMACVDCHNPHGESWRQEAPLHSVENESDALCFRCHAEQRGPFVWQHQAMEEGCTACHRPHGSPNRRLLRTSGNALCLQCHFERQLPRIGQADHQFRLSRSARCVDCHIRPHGSNVSEDLTQ